MEKRPYRVIYALDLETLVSMVNEHIAEGYEPCGGICYNEAVFVTPEPKEAWEHVFMQAMVLNPVYRVLQVERAG